MSTIETAKRHLKFAARTDWQLNPNQLTLRVKALREAGIEILDLAESNPTRCQFNYLTQSLLSPLGHSKNLRYEPSPKGILEARLAIQRDYQEKQIAIDPDHIFLTSSTSEAYSILFRLLTNPGDRVLIPRPSYPLFDFLARLNDVQLDSYAIRHDGSQWFIDTASIARGCHAETKAIVLVHPNHPTGSFVKEKEWIEISKLCTEKSMAVISDEVFSDFSISENTERLRSAAASPSEGLTFTLGGISKTLGLPQMKLAWMIVNGPPLLLEPCLERLEVISDTYLSVSTPIQNALPLWLQAKAGIQEEIKTRIKRNHSALLQQLSSSHPVKLLPTEGGWCAVLRIPRTKSEEEWVLEFLEQDHIYLYPGYFFDLEDEGFLVLSLLLSPKKFDQGVSRILKRVEIHS